MDKFYTKKEIATKCLYLMKKYIPDSNSFLKDIFIEPSAGSGSFSSLFSSIGLNVIAFDIKPENVGIIKKDYLTFNSCDLKKYKYNRIHVFGNPPFGLNSSLAKQFIKISAEYCDTISFILPKSFKKESNIKVFPLNFHNILTVDLPDNSFTLNDETCNLPCIFKIWIKKKILRKELIIEEPIYFKYVSKFDKPHFAIRRIGYYAGQFELDYMTCNENSHYFIKLNNYSKLNKFITNYNKVKFEENNTVGPRSISKLELNHQLNKLSNDMSL